MLLSQFINECSIELNKKQNKEKIELFILDPIINYSLDRLKPFFYITVGIIILLTLLIISLFIYIITIPK
jgi:hypothetical protein